MPGKAPHPDAVALIARAVLQLGRRLRAERPEGSVSLSALGILATLHRLGPLAAADLAKAERLKPQSLTRLIADLEKSGLIERQRDQIDRRQLIIGITASGRGALAHDMAARRKWLATAMERLLSDTEQRQLTRASGLMLRLAVEAQPIQVGGEG